MSSRHFTVRLRSLSPPLPSASHCKPGGRDPRSTCECAPVPEQGARGCHSLANRTCCVGVSQPSTALRTKVMGSPFISPLRYIGSHLKGEGQWGGGGRERERERLALPDSKEGNRAVVREPWREPRGRDGRWHPGAIWVPAITSRKTRTLARHPQTMTCRSHTHTPKSMNGMLPPQPPEEQAPARSQAEGQLSRGQTPYSQKPSDENTGCSKLLRG